MKNNLDNIIYSPKATPNKVETELKRIFYLVEVEDRNEPLFQFQFICRDMEENVLCIIAFGWSSNRERWFFDNLTSEE